MVQRATVAVVSLTKATVLRTSKPRKDPELTRITRGGSFFLVGPFWLPQLPTTALLPGHSVPLPLPIHPTRFWPNGFLCLSPKTLAACVRRFSRHSIWVSCSCIGWSSKCRLQTLWQFSNTEFSDVSEDHVYGAFSLP